MLEGLGSVEEVILMWMGSHGAQWENTGDTLKIVILDLGKNNFVE